MDKRTLAALTKLGKQIYSLTNKLQALADSYDAVLAKLGPAEVKVTPPKAVKDEVKAPVKKVTKAPKSEVKPEPKKVVKQAKVTPPVVSTPTPTKAKKVAPKATVAEEKKVEPVKGKRGRPSKKGK